MKLGKMFSRLKRRYNAGSINVTFTGKDGKVLRPHRKLNMLMVLSMYMRVNQNAVRIEFEKFRRRHGIKEKQCANSNGGRILG